MGRRCSFQRGFGRLAARFQGAVFIAVGGRRSRGGRLASRLGFGCKIIGDGAPLRIQPAKLFGPLRFGSCLGFAARLARLPLAAPLPRSSLCFGSGKNFRSSRSSWIPATSYSPKPFPAQYHQRLEA